jgi:hypothetical protein
MLWHTRISQLQVFLYCPKYEEASFLYQFHSSDPTRYIELPLQLEMLFIAIAKMSTNEKIASPSNSFPLNYRKQKNFSLKFFEVVLNVMFQQI